MATVKTVKVSARPHVTDSTNRGTVVVETPNQSVASAWLEQMLGKAPDGSLQSN